MTWWEWLLLGVYGSWAVAILAAVATLLRDPRDPSRPPSAPLTR